MAALTLETILTYAEGLPEDQLEMLEELLRNRRIESWRRETGEEAKKSAKAFRSGRLTPLHIENVIGQLRNELLESEA